MTDTGMQSRLQALNGQIRNALAIRDQENGPNHGALELLAVSKFHPVESILDAYALGLRHFGENRPQELRDKIRDGRIPRDCSFDCIGSIQSNKVKYLVGQCRLIQSLDRDELALRIAQRAQELGIRQDVLLQVNFAGEAQKHGYAATSLRDRARLQQLAELPGIRLRGLMCMSALGMDAEERFSYFLEFEHFFTEIREQLYSIDAEHAASFDRLSMGMSGDFREAIRAGSNCIRIGRAIFGERPAQRP